MPSLASMTSRLEAQCYTIRLLVELAEEQSAEIERLKAREAERWAHMRAGLERLRPLPAFREDYEEQGDV
jgi:hypothetical protein